MLIEKFGKKYELVIGLEVHAQINTTKKLFSKTEYSFARNPNTTVNFYDIALPGTLPVLNFEAIEKTIKTGIAINGTINKKCTFDRKNYFYPDLPSGYQITQAYKPIVENGFIEIKDANDNIKKIRIERIHIEQDAGKLTHDPVSGKTYIDFNRSGVPLMEIVTKPDIRSCDEAISYLKKLHGILRAIKSSDADMEKGSFRCDVNVSVMEFRSKTFGTRCEIKNVNSFKFIKDAIEFETNRQIELIESGQEVKQETRLYDSIKKKTFSIRTKENAADYKYFPDPDLLPITISDELIEEIKNTLPELPEKRKKRYMANYEFIERDAQALVEDENCSQMFDEVVQNGCDPKMAFSWIMVELLGRLKKTNTNIKNSNINTNLLVDLLNNIKNNNISGKIGKDVLDKMLLTGKTATDIISEDGLKQVDNSDELNTIIDRIISENNAQLLEYKSGKIKMFSFFVGQVMKLTDGKANPQKINEILKQKLDS